MLASAGPGAARGDPRPALPAYEQHRAAEQALCRARVALQEQGIAPELIETLIRVGIPADELVRAAQELEVDCILMGNRGNSLRQQVWRTLTGSTSRRVLRLASCPVMIVTHPRPQRGRNLVAWYEEAVRRSLQEQSHYSLDASGVWLSQSPTSATAYPAGGGLMNFYEFHPQGSGP